MTAKEYLNQAYRLDQRINSKLEQVASLRDLTTKATATMSDMPGGGSRNMYKMQDIIGKIIDLEKPNDKKRFQFKYKRIYSKKYRIDDSDDVMMTARSQVITAVNDLLRWERRLLDKLKEPVWV